MSKSIKKNYLFNLVNTLAGILFPLITFPYSARIMEADGIGQVGFFTSVITYISLFTSLGIPIYAIREIARVRDDIEEMSKTSLEILLLHTFLTFIGYVIVAILCMIVTKIAVNIPLFLILSLSIFFNAIGCEWFYRGVEDFKYIAIRGLMVRIIYVILLFSFVHSKSDILIYAALTVFGTVGNNIFNFIRLRKHISIKYVPLNDINISRHIKPTIKIFALNLVISLYVNLDTVMLGFLKNSTNVGYYEGATKISKLLLGIVQSLQTAMIPRFSYLARRESLDEFNRLCQRVIDFVVTVSLPMTIGLFILAGPLIHVFCGSTYEPAITTVEIISPIIFFISLSGVAGLQILYPLGKESLVIYSTVTGAIVNLIACTFFIPFYAHNGAALATVLGEITVAATVFLYGRKYIQVKRWSKHYSNCIIGSIVMLCSLSLLGIIELNDWQRIFVYPIIGVIVYGLYLFCCKDSFEMYICDLIVTKLKKK